MTRRVRAGHVAAATVLIGLFLVLAYIGVDAVARYEGVPFAHLFGGGQ